MKIVENINRMIAGATLADELYDSCMQLRELSGVELSTETDCLRTARTPQDDLRAARCARLAAMMDHRLGENCGRNVVRSICWGRDDYLRAQKDPDDYLRRTTSERFHLPIRQRRSLKGRMKKLRFRIRGVFRRMRVNHKRSKALRSLCYTLDGSLKGRRIESLSVRRLIDEAARLMSESVRAELSKAPPAPVISLPEREAAQEDMQMLTACSAAGEYILNRMHTPSGSDPSVDPYHLSVIEAFKMEAMQIFLRMEAGAERDALLLQCCKAFMLVNVGRIKRDRERSYCRRYGTDAYYLNCAVSDACSAFGNPLPAAAYRMDDTTVNEDHQKESCIPENLLEIFTLTRGRFIRGRRLDIAYMMDQSKKETESETGKTDETSC